MYIIYGSQYTHSTGEGVAGQALRRNRKNWRPRIPQKQEMRAPVPWRSAGLAHTMDDLIKLNHRIAAHWLGSLAAGQEAYLSYASVGLGQFTHSPAELAEVAARPKLQHHNCLPVAKLNRQYLRYAR